VIHIDKKLENKASLLVQRRLSATAHCVKLSRIRSLGFFLFYSLPRAVLYCENQRYPRKALIVTLPCPNQSYSFESSAINGKIQLRSLWISFQQIQGLRSRKYRVYGHTAILRLIIP